MHTEQIEHISVGAIKVKDSILETTKWNHFKKSN